MSLGEHVDQCVCLSLNMKLGPQSMESISPKESPDVSQSGTTRGSSMFLEVSERFELDGFPPWPRLNHLREWLMDREYDERVGKRFRSSAEVATGETI